MMKISSKTIVLERHPNAESQHHEAQYQMGQSAPTQPESWAIYSARGLGIQPIATGRTENEAWNHAATKVLEQIPEPTNVEIKRDVFDQSAMDRKLNPEAPTTEIEKLIKTAIDSGKQVYVVEPDGTKSAV